MKSPLSLFTEHPAAVGETYLQHLGSATGFAARMIGGGIACLLHGLLPFLFVRVGSATIDKLHDRMIVNRSRRLKAQNAPAPSYLPNSKALPTP